MGNSRRIYLLLTLGGLLVVAAIFTDYRSDTFLRARLKGKGYLTFFTLNSATTLYEGKDGKLTGPEHDLAVAFAEHVGVKPNFRTFSTVKELFEALKIERQAIAAAGLTQTEQRNRDYLSGPPYQKIREQILCNRTLKLGHTPSSLKQVTLWATESNSYLRFIKRLTHQYSDLSWRFTEQFSSEQLLMKAALKEISCVITDSNIASLNRRYLPELELVYTSKEVGKLSWYLNRGDTALQNLLQNWFLEAKQSGTLREILHRHYGFLSNFDYYDTLVFQRRIKSRLPRYLSLFLEAEKKYKIPWTLLAAMAYQESHWNPSARSPTGVEGMMMLTQLTAKAMGVTDRLDPKQSILGGAKYYSSLYRRFPTSIDTANRTWFTLASYNMGYSHLKDARYLAAEMNRDKDSWQDLKEILPLLSLRKHFQKLPHGYARGTQAIRYVRNIRDYRDILEKTYVTPKGIPPLGT